MQTYGEGVVSGYAGGGDYGTDQFLETRGAGKGEIVPKIGADVATAVVGGRVSKLRLLIKNTGRTQKSWCACLYIEVTYAHT